MLFIFLIGLLLFSAAALLYFIKLENNKTQKINSELELLLDNMSARDIYIHKMSQSNLVWDSKTQTYIKTME
jgi:hypothetical protein